MTIVHDAINDIQLRLKYNFQNFDYLLEAFKVVEFDLNFNQNYAITNDNKRLAQLESVAMKMMILENWYNFEIAKDKLSKSIRDDW